MLLNSKKSLFIWNFVSSHSLYSCKEEEIPFVRYESTNMDQLTGETSYLVATWQWIYTDHYYSWCENLFYSEYLDIATKNVQLQIQFFENGYVLYRKHEELISIYTFSFQYIDFDEKLFAMDQNGFDEIILSGYNYGNTMIFNAPEFLFYPEAGCEQYNNYFLKQ